jgi:zinc transport system substrate-binding protein
MNPRVKRRRCAAWRPAWLAALVVLVAVGLAGCGRSGGNAGSPQIAVTTSYLEAAARDLLGDDVGFIRLAEPGTCPGHFDIRPSQVQALRQARALLRFDFQKSLDAKLAGAESGGPRVAEVTVRGGMGRPDSYLAACRQAAEHFVALGLLAPTNAGPRLESIKARLGVLTRELTNRVAEAGLARAAVIASGHQRDFCEWLGLNVVAAFRPADTAGVREIEAAIAAGQHAQVRLIIANLPEGRRTADALAERLGARVVVFENFPALRQGRVAFDEMISANVEALLKAAQP